MRENSPHPSLSLKFKKLKLSKIENREHKKYIFNYSDSSYVFFINCNYGTTSADKDNADTAKMSNMQNDRKYG